MIEYIIGGGVFILFGIIGGYSKYMSNEYKKIKNDEIDSWIKDYSVERNSLKRRTILNRLSSKE